MRGRSRSDAVEFDCERQRSSLSGPSHSSLARAAMSALQRSRGRGAASPRLRGCRADEHASGGGGSAGSVTRSFEWRGSRTAGGGDCGEVCERRSLAERLQSSRWVFGCWGQSLRPLQRSAVADQRDAAARKRSVSLPWAAGGICSRLAIAEERADLIARPPTDRTGIGGS